jgi:hypothetical protein
VGIIHSEMGERDDANGFRANWKESKGGNHVNWARAMGGIHIFVLF